MTAEERAAYLIKECGTREQAIAHVNWVLKEATRKHETVQHWKSVLEILKK
jgi:hypothetical protein